MKIISGGQTGADRAALCAAKDCNLETGGYAPKRYLTEIGSDYSLKLFGLVDSGLDYVGRTELNAKNSDVTLWFGMEDTAGFKATKRSCNKFKKDFIDVTDCTSDTIYNIIKNRNVINIAGNRASMNKDIYSIVYTRLVKAFDMLGNGYEYS